jgi:predicted peptidase
MSASQKNPYDYEIDLPDGLTIPTSPPQLFPLIVFLHGIGECAGDKNVQVKKHGPWKEREFNAKVKGQLGEYFVVAPHIPQVKGVWEGNRILDTLCVAFEQIREENGGNVIDLERVYVTGISRGGKGALELAFSGFPDPGNIPCDTSQPKLVAFKAAAIICPEGGSAVGTKKETMYQFFHRENDFNAHTRNTYASLNSPSHARFHIYEGCNHNCWTATYANPALYEWFADPGKQVDWGRACDFSMCVEEAGQLVEVRRASGGQKSINASFCPVHAAQAKPWLLYGDRVRTVP